MCSHRFPVRLTLLHAFRLAGERHARAADAARGWLNSHGLGDASEPLLSISQLISASCPGATTWAAPGTTAIWPLEDALLQALGSACHAPDRAESMLAVLPGGIGNECRLLLCDLSMAITDCRANGLRFAPGMRMPGLTDAAH